MTDVASRDVKHLETMCTRLVHRPSTCRWTSWRSKCQYPVHTKMLLAHGSSFPKKMLSFLMFHMCFMIHLLKPLNPSGSLRKGRFRRITIRAVTSEERDLPQMSRNPETVAILSRNPSRSDQTANNWTFPRFLSHGCARCTPNSSTIWRIFHDYTIQLFMYPHLWNPPWWN